MSEGRSTSKKDGGWQVNLGLKQLILGGFGMVALTVMSFVLGTLAGRGEIYRVFARWGLLSPEASRVVQPWVPPAGVGPPLGQAAPAPGAAALPNAGTAATPAAQVAAASSPQAAQSAPAAGEAHPAHQAPVKGSLIPAGGSSAAKKKTAKPPAPPGSAQSKEEELKQLKAEVAKKLNFQNSLDKPPKPSQAQKIKVKDKDKAAPAKAPGSTVQVGRFREKKAAQAKLAEMQKRGEKVSLKEGKDQQGTYYAVVRQNPAPQPDDASLAQRKQKTDTRR